MSSFGSKETSATKKKIYIDYDCTNCKTNSSNEIQLINDIACLSTYAKIAFCEFSAPPILSFVTYSAALFNILDRGQW